MPGKLAILGAGSWGTALAIALENNFDSIVLWGFDPENADRCQRERENKKYLPGFKLPDRVEVTSELEPAADKAAVVLGVMPSKYARGIYARLSDVCALVSATKGLEQGTLQRMTQVAEESTGCRRVAVLSGPTFAREVAAGEPTALVIASTDADLARQLQQAFRTPSFRPYTSSDPVGVELAGALKNVIAIAAGVVHGLELGSNARAALVARGLAEMTRLAVAAGGKPETLAGLAGLGDLVLTCTGESSRNRAVGVELARGRLLEEIRKSTPMVAEGVDTTAAALALARRYALEMPITQQVHRILQNEATPGDAVRQLMDRSLRGE